MEKSAVPEPRPRRVGMVSLGCAKNLVDAEIMLGSLLRDGVEIVNDPAHADALIVNTCSFIDAAQEESIDAILESAEFRSQHRPDQAVIVSGCLPQRFRDDLPKLLPEVDAFMGIDQVEGVRAVIERAIENRVRKRASAGSNVELEPGPTAAAKARSRHRPPPDRSPPDHRKNLHDGSARALPTDVDVHRRPSYLPTWATPRFRLTPGHFAYLKIAEGCNHPCSFCIIPRMRGGHRSRSPDDIVEEARRLLGEGVRELNLISQDSTYYGLDLRPDAVRTIAAPDRFKAATKALPADAPTLPRLLERLNALSGDFWIRLLYTHPAHWTDELIGTIASCGKVARYVDMPLQHIHDEMLLRMRRETDGGYIRDLIGRIRAGIPGIALRTTFIVGFPGETQAHFDTLLEFIRQTHFERLGVFTYSKEDGTVAGRMTRQVPFNTRQKRRKLAMEEQRRIASIVSAGFMGRTLKVLVEGEASARDVPDVRHVSWEHGLTRGLDGASSAPKLARGLAHSVGRGEADAPDIDGRVYVRGLLPPGRFADVRVVGHSAYDLIAEPVE